MGIKMHACHAIGNKNEWGLCFAYQVNGVKILPVFPLCLQKSQNKILLQPRQGLE
jgi:hypothetical protein